MDILKNLELFNKAISAIVLEVKPISRNSSQLHNCLS